MARRGALLGLIAALSASPVLGASSLEQRLITIDRSTAWTQVAAIPVQFPTFHPQGMVRVGEDFFVSSVEVRRGPMADPARGAAGTRARVSATCSRFPPTARCWPT